MSVIGGEIGYRILRWYTKNGLPKYMDGSAYDGKSKLRVLLGEEIMSLLRDKDVIDFGCGAGAEAIEMAVAGARSVVGVDLATHRFPDAEQRARDAGVEDKVSFTATPERPADVVVSLDSFEHFDDPAAILDTMAKLLRPGGIVAVSFGPTWYHPLGGHLVSVFPWSHLIFSEAALMRWRADWRTDGATRFSEVEGGLNQMTIRRFERIVQDSPFRVVHLEAVPIRKLRPLASRITREFTTALVRCTLQLP